MPPRRNQNMCWLVASLRKKIKAGEGDGICLCVEDVRGVWLWREDEVGREREEVLESEGERVLERWKESLEEVLRRIREVEEALGVLLL